jgi:hypothetical protein
VRCFGAGGVVLVGAFIVLAPFLRLLDTVHGPNASISFVCHVGLDHLRRVDHAVECCCVDVAELQGRLFQGQIADALS